MEMLYPDHQLVALPTYRTEITLRAGVNVNVRLLGGTQIELLSGDDEKPVGAKVDYGRLFIVPLVEGETRLRLAVGDQAGELTFSDVETIVALEVIPTHVPGANPESEPAAPQADLYVQTGEILWTAGDEGQQVRVGAGNRLMLDAPLSQALAVVQEFPRWMTEDLVGLLDRRASAMLLQPLHSDRSPALVLLELTNHRQKEVRWLAVRCLGYMGQFDPMVAVLNDASHKLDWPDYIGTIRAAVWRSPKLAAGVRQAMEKRYGDEAAALYRMLWGYSLEDLKDRQAKILVEHLDHDTLAFRVLSFWNLKEITGWGLFYKPELTAAKRRQAVQKWWDRLESGEIWAKMAEEQQKQPVGQEAPPSGGIEPKG